MDANLAGNIVVGIATLGAAAISTYGARQARHAKKVGQSNAMRLERVQRQTSTKLDDRIRNAVLAVDKEHPGLIDRAVATEAIRDLLEAIVGLQLDAGDLEQLRAKRVGE